MHVSSIHVLARRNFFVFPQIREQLYFKHEVCNLQFPPQFAGDHGSGRPIRTGVCSLTLLSWSMAWQWSAGQGEEAREEVICI